MTRNAKVLVAYATKMGGDGRHRRGSRPGNCVTCGHEVDVRNVTEVGSLARYDVVVVGSAIYVRRLRGETVRFLRLHVDIREEGRVVTMPHDGTTLPDHRSGVDLQLMCGAITSRLLAGDYPSLRYEVLLHSVRLPSRCTAITGRRWVSRSGRAARPR
jgi:hypothetical protein